MREWRPDEGSGVRDLEAGQPGADRDGSGRRGTDRADQGQTPTGVVDPGAGVPGDLPVGARVGRPEGRAGVPESPLRHLVTSLRVWSFRRRLIAGVLVVPLLVVYASFGPGVTVWWAIPAALVSAVLAAAVLASYVGEPGSGRLVDVGCSPCAVIAGATILGSVILRDSAPADGGIALMATFLLGFGLAQRLGDAGTCSVAR